MSKARTTLAFLTSIGLFGILGCESNLGSPALSTGNEPKKISVGKTPEQTTTKIESVPLEALPMIGQPSISQSADVPTDTKNVSAFRDCPNCPEMIVVPQGSFVMGSSPDETSAEQIPEELASWEHPLHKVVIKKAFSIGRFPVTRGEFGEFVRETGYSAQGCYVFKETDWILDPAKNWQSPGFSQSDRHPAVCINWIDAQAYVHWLNGKVKGKSSSKTKTEDGPYRLPSEAEWEYAARAGTSTPNYWSNSQDQQCTYANGADLTAKEAYPALPNVGECQDGYAHTSPVGSFKENNFGLYDMIGNVWQWTADCWNNNYDNATSDGLANVNGDCKIHVVRGGSWLSSPGFLRSASRVKDASPDRSDYSGFRIVKDIPVTNHKTVPDHVASAFTPPPAPHQAERELPKQAPESVTIRSETDDRRILAHIASFKKMTNAERAWRDANRKYDLQELSPVYKEVTLPNGELFIRVFASGNSNAVRKLCSTLRQDKVSCHIFDADTQKMLW